MPTRTFEAGIAVGQALSDIKNNTRRIAALEGEVASIKALVVRGMLLAALATVGVVGNLSAATLGETAAAFAKAWLK
jgi:hypothetical protein